MKKFLFLLLVLACLSYKADTTCEGVIGKYKAIGSALELKLKKNGTFEQIFHVIHRGSFPGTWTCSGGAVELTFRNEEYGVVEYRRVGSDTLKEVKGGGVFVKVR